MQDTLFCQSHLFW